MLLMFQTDQDEMAGAAASEENNNDWPAEADQQEGTDTTAAADQQEGWIERTLPSSVVRRE